MSRKLQLFSFHLLQTSSCEAPVDLFYNLVGEGKKLLSGLPMMEKKTFNNICCKVFFLKLYGERKLLLDEENIIRNLF